MLLAHTGLAPDYGARQKDALPPTPLRDVLRLCQRRLTRSKPFISEHERPSGQAVAGHSRSGRRVPSGAGPGGRHRESVRSGTGCRLRQRRPRAASRGLDSAEAHAEPVVLESRRARPPPLRGPRPEPFQSLHRGAHLVPGTRRFPRSDQIQTRPPAPATRSARTSRGTTLARHGALGPSAPPPPRLLRPAHTPAPRPLHAPAPPMCPRLASSRELGPCVSV